MSASLALAAIAFAALSGVPGLGLPREGRAADRVGALLLAAAALCAAAASALAFAGAPDVERELPWRVLGERVTVGVDGLSAFFLPPIFLVASLGSVYALAYWPAPDHATNARRLRLAYGLLAAGVGLVVIARHAFAFLAGWEVMAIASFFSITAEDEREAVRRAGFVYLACTRVSTLALVGAFALLHEASGSYALRALASPDPALAVAAFWLAFAGFALKAGVMPLHLWLPDAHAMAPSHVSALLSGVMIKVGIYGIVRMASLLSPLPASVGAWVLALGVASTVLGVAFALGQHSLKRLLAYHSIENIGIILIGVGAGLLGRALGRPELAVLGLAGALLHVWNHALFKSLLFLGAGSVLHATGCGELDRLGGLARRLPRTALCFAVGAIAICGLPPLNGFVSELLLYLGLLRTALGAGGGVRLAAIAAIAALAFAGGLAAACFAKAYGVVFLGEPRGEVARAGDPPPAMLAPMAALAALCVAIGVAPQLALPALEAALRSFDAALATAAPPLAALAPFGAVSAGAALLAALALAAAAASRRALRSAPRPLTWDCGYAAPSARMQYTASSFADGLVGLFRWALLPEIHAPRATGLFAEPANLHTHVPDPMLDRLVLPASAWVGRASLWLRWIQRGRVHAYVLYIALALVAALVAARGGAG